MKPTRLIIGSVFLLVIVLVPTMMWLNRRSATTLQPASREEIRRAIVDGGEYLLRQIEPSGRFVYRVNTNPKIRMANKYNVLRHAGAIYALGSYLSLFPNEAAKAKVLAAARYLVEHSLGPVPGQKNLATFWATPEKLDPTKFRQHSKLGGAGLGLVALLSARRLDEQTITVAKLGEVGAFLEFMQLPDGSFYSKYFPDQEGRSNKWTSLYYPGEAALGAALLYAVDPQPRWLEIGVRALGYLAQLRRGKGTDVEADHWALLATQMILPHLSRLEKSPVNQQELIDHAKQIVQKMLAEFKSIPPRSPAYGGCTRDGRTTPAATRLEGLLAAYEFLPESDHALKTEILSVSQLGAAWLIRSMMTEGPFQGGVPRAISQVKKGQSPESIREFNMRSSEIRIDYVQHVISALIQLDAILARSNP